MLHHLLWFIFMSYDTSPIIDAWSYHMIHHRRSCHIIKFKFITFHRFIFMSYDTSPTIDAWSCHMMHHLSSMHGHVIWYITYHRCMVMSFDTSPTNRCMVMSCDTSTIIDAWSCHMIHHLPSMHGHVIWYITYHRCMVMSYDISPTNLCMVISCIT